ncbi:DUF6807 family protein [Cellulomonas fulva]|uniref:DUF6807 family protein n=1 Tax=Cellulomonas fulva TaxID=2835530 RepID=UPI0027DDDD0D|nr:DUF6807 family protein [Cellulomonas fulva]
MTQNAWARPAPTIAEVAQAAGVSRATVSRVMNGRATVDEQLAARVREAAERLHYRPSTVARSLSLGRTNTVAVVVPDLANPMFQQVLRGVSAAAAEDGYRVLVADTSESTSDERQVALDARLRCDALVLVSPRMPEAELRALLPEVGPVVVINREPDGRTPTLAIDYAAGIEDVVEHLVGLGHRHLLYLGGPPASASHGARLAALRAAAARRAEVRLSERAAGSSVDSGYAAAGDVLASRATAVVAYNDLVAFGLLARLNELGVAVPGDVSVTGFDDIELARFAIPSLTTVTVPQLDLGRAAWGSLAGIVGIRTGGLVGLGADVPGGGTVDEITAAFGAGPIRPRLAVRASTGPVPPSVRSAGGGRTAPAATAPEVAAVRWTVEGGVVRLDGAAVTGEELPLARYEDGERVPPVHSPRPFLHPVRTAGGVALTETSPVDHRHHYGVSMAVPVVNGTSYWGGRTYVRDEGPTLLPNHGRQAGGAARVSPDGRGIAQDVVWYDEHGGVLLREGRTLTAGTAAGGWSLCWRSRLHATERDLSIESPGTNGRANAGYGGLFWRLPSADSTLVLGQGLVGEASVHGSESPWLAFVQRRDGAATTLLLVQDPATVRPWFARVAEYVGAGPALAWDTPLLVPAGGGVTVGLGAVVVDRVLDADEADALASELTAGLVGAGADGRSHGGPDEAAS